jgi:hypothetical protein
MYILNVFATIITYLNPLKAELNLICHLLALLGAHHIFHVSRIGVKHIMINILKILIILTILRILNVANQRKFWEYVHSTHITEFQHNSLQKAQLKAGINYKDS